MAAKILVIEDEQRLRRILKLVLLDAGYDVQTAADGEEGILAWQKWMPDVVLTDLKMEPVDGIEVLKFRNRNGLDAPLIILTAFGTVETAVDAMKDSAFDYLNKPIDNNELLDVVAKALESRPNTGTNKSYKMIGSSPAMQKIKKDIALFATGDTNVLISGASGTGKELVARAIHSASQRNSGPFVKINCAAIPAELMESELFGYRKGAFTGASTDYEGAFSRSNGGVLFLDEVGDLPLELQAKLLNVVEEKVVTPLGSGEVLKVGVKILSATNHDLKKMILDKVFRADLYYRLNTVNINLPSLRERVGDLELLIPYFLNIFSKSLNKKLPEISGETIELLHDWSWPGNIRELSNVMERAVLTCKNGQITPGLLPWEILSKESNSVVGTSPSMDLNSQEKNLIISALTKRDWNKSQAAKVLGISRNALRYRIKKFGISNQ